MFGKKYKLFTIFGFEISIDLSWIFLAVLITWTLARGYFPQQFEGLSTAAYWYMGAAGALGLFVSIIFHELSHSLVARQYGLPMEGITLFIFGGVAHMHEEPEEPRTEFLMAVAGPIASVVLAGILWSGSWLLGDGAPVWATGVLDYLVLLNLVLAAFNLIPAFPLDGGRMLRAALWSWRGDLRWASRMAAQAGATFGLVLIALGVFNFLAGSMLGGVWWVLIGLFVRNAAQGSYQQVLVRRALEGDPVRRYMNNEPVSVPEDLTVAELVEKYVYRHHLKMFPVEDAEGNLKGCVTTRAIKEIDREAWPRTRVAELADQCGPENTIRPEEDVLDALGRMRSGDTSRLMVVDEEGRLVGVLALRDLMEFLSLKIELEESGS